MGEEMTVEDAVEAISVAAALGQEIAAPPGSFVWTVTVDWWSSANSEKNVLIGVYATPEAAKRGLRNWAVEDWTNDLHRRAGAVNHPVNTMSDDDFLKVYFDSYPNKRGSVSKIQLAPHPAAKYQWKNGH